VRICRVSRFLDFSIHRTWGENLIPTQVPGPCDDFSQTPDDYRGSLLNWPDRPRQA
jgi:hypothetical protein